MPGAPRSEGNDHLAERSDEGEHIKCGLDDPGFLPVGLLIQPCCHLLWLTPLISSLLLRAPPPQCLRARPVAAAVTATTANTIEF